MRLNKDDIYSLIGTVAFHGVILLILWFTVLKTEVPDEDGGVLVNFGNVDAAAGMFEPKYTGQEPPQETTTPPPPVPEPQPRQNIHGLIILHFGQKNNLKWLRLALPFFNRLFVLQVKISKICNLFLQKYCFCHVNIV